MKLIHIPMCVSSVFRHPSSTDMVVREYILAYVHDHFYFLQRYSQKLVEAHNMIVSFLYLLDSIGSIAPNRLTLTYHCPR